MQLQFIAERGRLSHLWKVVDGSPLHCNIVARAYVYARVSRPPWVSIVAVWPFGIPEEENWPGCPVSWVAAGPEGDIPLPLHHERRLGHREVVDPGQRDHRLAVGETVILLHLPLPLVGVSIIWMTRGCLDQ